MGLERNLSSQHGEVQRGALDSNNQDAESTLDLTPKQPFFVIMGDGTCYGVGKSIEEAKAEARKYTDLDNGTEYRYAVVCASDEDDAQAEAESEWTKLWGQILSDHYLQGIQDDE